jgi:hypothetical protein
MGAVRGVVVSSKASIVRLQETKIESFNRYLIMQCLGPAFDDYCYLPALGTKGGVLIAWDSSIVGGDSVFTGEFLVCLFFM